MTRLRDDAGATTIWMLGLSVLLLGIGGLAVDLWRVGAERRALAGIADAASTAAATAVDDIHLRTSGELRLDDPLARDLAATTVAAGTVPSSLRDVAVVVDGTTAIARVEGEVRLTLLALLAPDTRSIPIVVEVTAEARPRD